MKSKKKQSLQFDRAVVSLIVIKILLIGMFLFGIFYDKSSFTNTVSVLAVSTLNGEYLEEGSTIDLTLEIEPGSGNIFVNLDTFEEIDTQASIVNSQKIACQLFNLDCQNFDFYYSFDGPSLILQGPSASAAIAVLTAKTVNNVKLDQSTVITGLLNSGGIIGNVGGVPEKVVAAEMAGFEKVLVPQFSSYNISGNETIEVVKVLDIIDVYNNFNGDKFSLSTREITDESYDQLMEQLATKMCFRADSLFDELETTSFEANSTQERYYNQSTQSRTSATLAKSQGNFYSAGSFCYSTNINNRALVELQEEPTLQELDLKLNTLRDRILYKRLELKSNSYLADIETINDFYVYLLLVDRVEEALDLVEDGFNQKIENVNASEITLEELREIEKQIVEQKTAFYANAAERFHTVLLWEEFIVHTGSKISFDDQVIENACTRISRDVNIRNQLLRDSENSLFNDEINEQNNFQQFNANKYLCIYRGVELSGKMNTVLNAIGISNNESLEYAQNLREIAYTRLVVNTKGNFPLIPYIYYEYSGDLLNEEQVASSLLYSNYALAYTDLNIFLEEERKEKAMFNQIIDQLFENFVFLAAFLTLLAFLS